MEHYFHYQQQTEYLVKPYWFVSALSVFQTFIKEVHREFLHNCIITHLDDILMCFKTETKHILHVCAMLHILSKNN